MRRFAILIVAYPLALLTAVAVLLGDAVTSIIGRLRLRRPGRAHPAPSDVAPGGGRPVVLS